MNRDNSNASDTSQVPLTRVLADEHRLMQRLESRELLSAFGALLDALEDPEEFSRWVDDVEALAWDWPCPEVDLHPNSLLRDHV